MLSTLGQFRSTGASKHAVQNLVQDRPKQNLVVETMPKIDPHARPIGLCPMTFIVVVLQLSEGQKRLRDMRRTNADPNAPTFPSRHIDHP